MENPRQEIKESETAFFSALRRAIANKDYKSRRLGPDDLAEYFLPPYFRFFLRFKKVRENTKEKLDGFLPGLTEFVIARTSYFDDLFVDALEKNFQQIVFLGAGYDSRAYRFEALAKETKIYELDAAPTQNRKNACLKKAKIQVSPNVIFVPIDFNINSLKNTLNDAGYQDNQRTLFIWEGVSYYLESESVDATLAFVSQNSHHESLIAFDYTISVTENTLNDHYGVKEFSQTMKEHHPNEELLFSIEKGQIITYLEKRGLKVLEHLDNHEIEKRFLLDDQGDLIGHMTGHFCFVLASPVRK
ncbi:MAG: SAM-dependent methyltransferase [Chloroflexota bacterium]